MTTARRRPNPSPGAGRWLTTALLALNWAQAGTLAGETADTKAEPHRSGVELFQRHDFEKAAAVFRGILNRERR